MNKIAVIFLLAIICAVSFAQDDQESEPEGS